MTARKPKTTTTTTKHGVPQEMREAGRRVEAARRAFDRATAVNATPLARQLGEALEAYSKVVAKRLGEEPPTFPPFPKPSVVK